MINTRKLLGIMALNGITQKELAEKIICSKNTISCKIRGLKPFNIDEALKICDILAITDSAEKAEIFLTQPSQK